MTKHFWLAAMAMAQVAAAPSPTPIKDPLKPAREGKMQCVNPDLAAKTCTSIYSYQFDKTGFVQTLRVALPNEINQIDIVIENRGNTEGGSICTTLSASQAVAFRLEEDWQSQGGANAFSATPYMSPWGDDMLERFRNATDKLIDKKICRNHYSAGKSLFSRAVSDGVVSPRASDSFVWVDPRDRYRLVFSEPKKP